MPTLPLHVAALIAAVVFADVAVRTVGRMVDQSFKASPSTALIQGAVALVLAYLFMGVWSAWPPAIGTALVAVALARVSPSVERADAWIWLRVGMLVLLSLLGIWLVSDADASRGWPASWYVLLAIAAGGYITVEWAAAWIELAIRPFAASVTLYEDESGLPSGGRMIGRLERLLIYLFVLIDAPTAIGFLVTAKSILRFGEIRDSTSHRRAEYIIIGTLISFGFAIVSAYLVRVLFRIPPI